MAALPDHDLADRLDPFERMLYKAERERDEARRQMQSLTEDYVAMEARAIKAEATVREQAEQLDTLRNAESVGVSYCTLHHGIANEDDRHCDFADDDDECDEDGEPRPCVLVELIQRPGLAAAGGGVPEEGATDE